MTDGTGTWADNGEVRLWWQRFTGPGGGIPLLLINGLGSPSVAYQHGFIGRLVVAGFDVIRFDNHNLDAAGWDRAVVFGQSMGG